MLKTNLGALRLLGILEGISFIILLGICVPLKYIFDIPQATQLTGMAHGVLFLAYCHGCLSLLRNTSGNFKLSFFLLLLLCFHLGLSLLTRRFSSLKQVFSIRPAKTLVSINRDPINLDATFFKKT